MNMDRATLRAIPRHAVASNDSLCAVGGNDKVVHVLGADGRRVALARVQ
jgi:hypothetical protein